MDIVYTDYYAFLKFSSLSNKRNRSKYLRIKLLTGWDYWNLYQDVLYRLHCNFCHCNLCPRETNTV